MTRKLEDLSRNLLVQALTAMDYDNLISNPSCMRAVLAVYVEEMKNNYEELDPSEESARAVLAERGLKLVPVTEQ